MFYEFTTQVWTPSDGSVVVSNNTDTSIDGSCKSIVWTDGQDQYVTMSFDEIDLSTYEEISFHLYMGDVLENGNIFKITIDSNDYIFTRDDLRKSRWNHILIDCSSMTTISSIIFTSLISDFTLFVDYLGYRKVTYNCDIDIITALKLHINLDYDVSTTLSSAASAGDEEISLTSDAYVTDTSILEIDNGTGTIETVELISKDGTLNAELVNSFANGSEVRVICPIRGDDYDSLQPDPICAIKVYDINVDKEQAAIKMKDGSKIKEYLGSLGIIIYIDCSSKKKLMQMAREFNKKYGREFKFLLDGEQVEIYLDTDMFTDSIIGNNPRMAYYYQIDPQPYLLANVVPITDITVTVDSSEVI
ncbi:MAG: hypothetical protein ACFFG0_02560 [Candidatus Thorarchaeota archaeon]